MSDSPDDYSRTLELQRRAFEEQFGSLESLGYEDKTRTRASSVSQDHSGSDSSEYASDASDPDLASERDSGNDSDSHPSSDPDSDSHSAAPSHRPQHPQHPQRRPPRVIKFNGPTDTYLPPAKHELRQLKTGKPLQQRTVRAARASGSATASDSEDDNDDNDDNDAQNLRNDLELQRFLAESHLLNAFDAAGHHNDSVTGKARARTLEMRLKNLSATNGSDAKIHKLEKVPINVRKGMIDKHLKRIADYEKDAKDAGVVLSHLKKGQFRKIDATYKKDIERRIGPSIKARHSPINKKRQKGLKIHTVGQSTRNGLVISKRDIDRINGRH